MGRTVGPALLKQLSGQSMAATFTSPVIDTLMMDQVSWEGVATGTPTGTLTVEASNQYDSVLNPTPTFVAMPATTPALPVPAGAGFSFLVTTPGVGGIGSGVGRFQRMRFVRSAGTGSMDLYVTGTAK